MKTTLLFLTLLIASAASAEPVIDQTAVSAVFAAITAVQAEVTDFSALATSVVAREGGRQIVLATFASDAETPELELLAVRDGKTVARAPLGRGKKGRNELVARVPRAGESADVEWRLCTRDGGRLLASARGRWAKPRPWTLYAVASTHTDIGLHESPYWQRDMSVRFIDRAAELIDADARGDADPSAYRYIMEGTWYWNNYPQDRGADAARNIVTNYIRRGRMGIGATCAGNHTHVYGFEELARSAGTRRRLRDGWGVDSGTMMMADINGVSWSVVAPYVDAGIRNMFYCPNQWNPRDSTLWPMDRSVVGTRWNPDAGGGGSRVDVGYDSDLPLVFWWLAPDRASKMLVWASTQYCWGGCAFGISDRSGLDTHALLAPSARTLAKLERRYPFDIWLFASYGDNERPNRRLQDLFVAWNARYETPVFRLTGDLDEPFDRLRRKWGGEIETLAGDMVPGWAQHPVSTPMLLAAKFEADRTLAAAETASSFAALERPGWKIRKEEIDRAWQMLIFNDEHSYGTSGYKGRRVFETWMQHRDWIERAAAVASNELVRATDALGARRAVPPPGVTCRDGVTENVWYRVTVTNGVITSLYDKELCRELVDVKNGGALNRFLFTRDNHKTMVSPDWVRAEIRLLSDRKGVEIVNRFTPLTEMFNDARYDRYGYTAFPFDVPGGRFAAQLNGPVIDPSADITGHNTDAYAAVRDWVSVGNGAFGVAVVAPDTHLFEFGRIHPDKTAFGEKPATSHIYNYLFNDWLQMHLPSGASLAPVFRYVITSYRGDWRRADIPAFAARVTERFPADGRLRIDAPNVALTVLKRADDGRGFIARFRETLGRATETSFALPAIPSARYVRCSIAEEDRAPLPGPRITLAPFGYATVRILPADDRACTEPSRVRFTGLIDAPRAGHGERPDMMYLLWGRDDDPAFSHYELYRDGRHIADVENERYVCARYVDGGLKPFTRYTYTLRSVYRDGRKGPLSAPFTGVTSAGNGLAPEEPAEMMDAGQTSGGPRKPDRAPVSVRRWFFAGDSTLHPRRGARGVSPEDACLGSWGEELFAEYAPDVVVSNLALSGTTTLAWIKSGRWDLLAGAVRPGDRVLIQFGHNDMKERYERGEYTAPFLKFKDRLWRFVADLRARGAEPVFASPIARGTFSADGTLEETCPPGGYPLREYGEAMRWVAERNNVAFIDMNALTREAVRAAGPGRSRTWYRAGKFPATRDFTHPTREGARVFARLFLDACPPGFFPVVARESADGRFSVREDGATVTGWIPAASGGREVFFLPQKTPWGKEVHGGIPVCWPWFGTPPKEGLPKHGLVRYLKWRFVRRIGTGGAEFAASSTPQTLALWPHSFELRLTVAMTGPSSLELRLTEMNTGTAPFESAWGFHPYFRVTDAARVAVDGVEQPNPSVRIRTSAGEKGRIRTLTDLVSGRMITVSATDNEDWFVWNPGVDRTPLCDTLLPDEWRNFYCLEPCALTPRPLEPGERRVHGMTVSVAF